MLVTPVLDDLPFTRRRVLAFVNGMGGTPLLELYVSMPRWRSSAKPGAHDRAQPGRQLHHLAGDAGLFNHAAQARRRDGALLGCAGEYAGPALGRVLAITRDSTVDWMSRFAGEMSEHRQELVALDTAIGDSDHGTNMDRGMRKALEKLDSAEPADPGAVLKTVAMALVSSVGGAAGRCTAPCCCRWATRCRDRTRWTWPASPAHGERAWRASRRGARHRPVTRRWSTRCRRRSRRYRARRLDQGLQAAVQGAERG